MPILITSKKAIFSLILLLAVFHHGYCLADEYKTIYYAGFGNISGDRGQPFFSSLYGTQGNEHLRESLNQAITKKVAQLDFSFPSVVVVADEDIVKYIGINNQRVKSGKILAHTDIKETSDCMGDGSVLLLTLVSTLELNPIIETHSRMGDLCTNEFITGVTALLVEPGSGHIVLSANAIGYTIYKDTKEIVSDDINEKFSLSYKKTAFEALDRLQKLSLTEKWEEWSMVTEVSVNDRSVQKLFDYRNDNALDYKEIHSRNIDDVIRPDSCLSDSCAKLRALLAQGASDILSTAGHNMLPPFLVTAWGRTAYGRASFSIQLTESGGKQEKFLRINVSPKSAMKKIKVVLPKFAEKDFGKGHISSMDIYHGLKFNG